MIITLVWGLVFMAVVGYVAWPYLQPRPKPQRPHFDADETAPQRGSIAYDQAKAAFIAAMDRSGGQLGGETMPLALASAAPCLHCGWLCDAGHRFCTGCGARLVPHTEHEAAASLLVEPVSDKTKRLLIMLATVALSVTQGWAQGAPHDTGPTGTITGHLQIRQGQTTTALRNTPYRVEVRKADEVLVSVVKTTDADGMFSIRNVLPTATLQYVVTATVGDATYISAPLQLPPDQPTLQMDQLLTADASARPVDPNEPPIMPQMGSQPGAAASSTGMMPSSVPRVSPLEGNPGFRPNPVRLADGAWGREQWVAIVLSGIAAVLVLVQAFAKRS